MYFLVYSSTAAEGFDEVELQIILDASARNNAPLSITGMLLFFDGSFIQLLEGPKENVERLYEKIKQDTRHENLLTLYKGESTDRYFPRWKMAFETVDEAAKASADSFQNVEAVSEFLSSANFDHQGLKLLRYFYKLKRDKES